MQKFIGTKQLEALPMSRGEYNTYRGWTIPADENPLDSGFLVRYSDGYESWSPEKQFNEAYRPLTAMTFGHAIEMMKAGHAVARAGWNGKGMYLFYAMEQEVRNGMDCKKTKLAPHILMKTTQDDLVPWLPSQTDMLADDWSVVSVTPQA